jgi:hypothetical protein
MAIPEITASSAIVIIPTVAIAVGASTIMRIISSSFDMRISPPFSSTWI